MAFVTPTRQKKPVLVYCYPIHGEEFEAYRFVQTYLRFPPGFLHDTIVIVNGGLPTSDIAHKFSPIPNCRFFSHDDSGWDIGAYLALAKSAHVAEYSFMFCLGGPSYFQRAGWLKQMWDAWVKYGPGMYGTLSSFEIRPHLCTTGFAISPEMLRQYPHPVVERLARYEFEWGKGAMWHRVRAMRRPVMLVTWDGVWAQPQWRTPPNIYRRGDQSNCVTYARHADEYYKASPEMRERMSFLVDGRAGGGCELQLQVDAASKELAII